jgi:hypothetical protein
MNTETPTAKDIVSRIAAIWEIEIRTRGYTARDLAERAFQCRREMGYRSIKTGEIVEASAERFHVAPETVLKTAPHPDTIHLLKRGGR